MTFEKGQRKDDVAQEYLAAFDGRGGRPVHRQGSGKGQRLPHRETTDAQGNKYPWIIRSTAMPNHYYFYILDRDFGPLFIKFCSYFPVPRETLSQWARVVETAADAAGGAVRAVGQWDPLE